MRFLLPTLVLIALFPFNAQAGTQDDEALVRAHVGKLTTTWNSHDMKAFAQLFSDDAQFVNVVGMWWKNRSEIEAAMLRAIGRISRIRPSRAMWPRSSG
jgi:hypothetical protein